MNKGKISMAFLLASLIALPSIAEDTEQNTATDDKKATSKLEQPSADSTEDNEELKVVKLSPKVKTVARDFKEIPCNQLGAMKPKGEQEKRKLKKRKNQCVNSVNAFMKGR